MIVFVYFSTWVQLKFETIRPPMSVLVTVDGI